MVCLLLGGMWCCFPGTFCWEDFFGLPGEGEGNFVSFSVTQAKRKRRKPKPKTKPSQEGKGFFVVFWQFCELPEIHFWHPKKKQKQKQKKKILHNPNTKSFV
jgi:hypothetical protein